MIAMYSPPWDLKTIKCKRGYENSPQDDAITWNAMK